MDWFKSTPAAKNNKLPKESSSSSNNNNNNSNTSKPLSSSMVETTNQQKISSSNSFEFTFSRPLPPPPTTTITASSLVNVSDSENPFGGASGSKLKRKDEGELSAATAAELELVESFRKRLIEKNLSENEFKALGKFLSGGDRSSSPFDRSTLGGVASAKSSPKLTLPHKIGRVRITRQPTRVRGPGHGPDYRQMKNSITSTAPLNRYGSGKVNIQPKYGKSQKLDEDVVEKKMAQSEPLIRSGTAQLLEDTLNAGFEDDEPMLPSDSLFGLGKTLADPYLNLAPVKSITPKTNTHAATPSSSSLSQPAISAVPKTFTPQKPNPTPSSSAASPTSTPLKRFTPISKTPSSAASPAIPTFFSTPAKVPVATSLQKPSSSAATTGFEIPKQKVIEKLPPSPAAFASPPLTKMPSIISHTPVASLAPQSQIRYTPKIGEPAHIPRISSTPVAVTTADEPMNQDEPAMEIAFTPMDPTHGIPGYITNHPLWREALAMAATLPAMEFEWSN